MLINTDVIFNECCDCFLSQIRRKNFFIHILMSSLGTDLHKRTPLAMITSDRWKLIDSISKQCIMFGLACLDVMHDREVFTHYQSDLFIIDHKTILFA